MTHVVFGDKTHVYPGEPAASGFGSPLAKVSPAW